MLTPKEMKQLWVAIETMHGYNFANDSVGKYVPVRNVLALLIEFAEGCHFIADEDDKLRLVRVEEDGENTESESEAGEAV